MEGASSVSESSSYTKNIFLQPLSFPEPQTKDMSHFLYPSKDVPIMCLFPTCSEVFGEDSSPTSCGEDLQSIKQVDCTPDPGRVNRLHVADDGGERVKLLTTTMEGVKLEESLCGIELSGEVVKARTSDNSEGVCTTSRENQEGHESEARTSPVKSEGVNEESQTAVSRFGPKDEWLRHLFLSHKMVVDKVNEISSLKRCVCLHVSACIRASC